VSIKTREIKVRRKPCDEKIKVGRKPCERSVNGVTTILAWAGYVK
jgi:hypothetical protein